MAGKTRSSVKTDKLRGKSIVRGGAGTASRTLGLFGALLTYAINAGIIDSNPAHGIRKPKDQVRQRRLTEAEYRQLGQMLAKIRCDHTYSTSAAIIRLLVLTGCRCRGFIGFRWDEVVFGGICFRMAE